MEQPVDSNVLFGIAKKWTLELEGMSLQAQGTVISFMNSALQYRKLNMEQLAHQKQVEAMARQTEFMETQQKRQQEQEDLKRSGLVIAH